MVLFVQILIYGVLVFVKDDADSCLFAGRSILMDKGILYMEMLVVLQGLRLTAADGMQWIIIESDSMEVVKILNKESDPPWNLINLV